MIQKGLSKMNAPATLDYTFIEKMIDCKIAMANKIRSYLIDDESTWHEWHRNLYDNNADMYQWSDFIVHFRLFLKMDKQNPTPFDQLWQRHTLLNQDPDTAIQECIDFILGD